MVEGRKAGIQLNNVLSLSGIQAANYLIPFLVFPYIARVIGPEKFGLVNYAQSIIAYFTLAINYGFDFSATRSIAQNLEDKDIMNQIFSSVIFTKLSIAIISIVFFFILLIFVPQFNSHFSLYFYSFLIIIGNIFFPTWFFQGIQQLKWMSFFNFCIKLIFALSILFIVKTPADFIFIPLSMSLANIAIGFFAFAYAINRYHIQLLKPKKAMLLTTLREGRKIFYSTLVMNFYTVSNTLILGLITHNDSIVGYFSGASKIIAVFQQLIFVPVSQTLYPHVANIIKSSTQNGILYLKKVLKWVALSSFLVFLIVLIIAGPIVEVVLGPQFTQAVPSLRILSIIIFLVAVNNVYGMQAMLNLKFDKQFLIILFLGCLLNIFLNIMLTPKFLEIGTCLSWVVTELFVTITFVVFLATKKVYLI